MINQESALAMLKMLKIWSEIVQMKYVEKSKENK